MILVEHVFSSRDCILRQTCLTQVDLCAEGRRFKVAASSSVRWLFAPRRSDALWQSSASCLATGLSVLNVGKFCSGFKEHRWHRLCWLYDIYKELE